MVLVNFDVKYPHSKTTILHIHIPSIVMDSDIVEVMEDRDRIMADAEGGP
jgi:hypothetical protein